MEITPAGIIDKVMGFDEYLAEGEELQPVRSPNASANVTGTMRIMKLSEVG